MAPRPKPGDPRSLDPLGGGGLRHNPFAALRPEGEPAPADAPDRTGSAPAEGSSAKPGAEGRDLEPSGRLVVALERKGHGGKSVVRVQGFDSAAQAKEMARAMGKALGRGARASGPEIVVQGADLDGPIDWLRGRGLERIVRGTP